MLILAQLDPCSLDLQPVYQFTRSGDLSLVFVLLRADNKSRLKTFEDFCEVSGRRACGQRVTANIKPA